MSNDVIEFKDKKSSKKILDEYEAAYVPDTGHFSELLELCKGARNWRDFAEMCGRSAATFSRLSNSKKITKQIDKNLIYQIYTNQVEDGQVDLEELLKAGGWRRIRKKITTPPEKRWEPSEEEKARFEKERRDYENRRRLINGIIRSELDNRGQFNRFYDNGWGSRAVNRNPVAQDEGLKNSDFGLRYYLSSGFTVQVLDMDPPYWCFYPIESMLDGRKIDWSKYDEEEMERRRFFALREVMNSGFSDVFLKDMWEPETLKNIKTTIIYNDQIKFDMVWDALSKKQFNNWFSLLLIDLEEEKVFEERILPRADGKEKDAELLFALPVKDGGFDWGDPLDE